MEHIAEPYLSHKPGLVERINSLSEALESHYDWLWSVQRAIVCGDPHPTVAACTLDAWIKRTSGQMPEHRIALERLCGEHEAMHAAAARLLDGIAAAPGVPLPLYDGFLQQRKQFKQAAAQLERALWSSGCFVDALTGLRNRHAMIHELHEEQQRAVRDGRSWTLAMMDIDHFKSINDDHGHFAGDQVLRAVTQLTARKLRPYDRVYRYGGEEFLICLPDTDLGRAQAIIDRLRAAIARRSVAVGEAPLRVTVSFGLAAVDPKAPVDATIQRADRALYAAKAAGRNCVFAAS